MVRSFRLNIYYLYLIKLSKWLMLIMPIVALFYNENGLGDLDIFLLQAVYSVSVAVLEIPSGYMADIVGRKKTLVIGSILGSVGFVIYTFSSSFMGFLLAEIVLGIGGSLISGSDSAMLFDSLAVTRRQQLYLQFEGRITSLGNFAETAAAVCGGLLAGFLGYRAVYLSQALIAAIAIPAALLLIEPPREKLSFRPGFKHIIFVCRKTLLTDKKLSSIITISSITGITTLTMAWSSQIYFVSRGFTETLITPLWVTLNLTVAMVAAFAPKIVLLLGKRLSLTLIFLFLPLAFILVGYLPTIPAICCMFLFYAIRGYATPVLKDLINQNCGTATRATVLSIRSLIIRLGFAILGPTIGWLSDAKSLSLAFILAGTILLLLTLLTGCRLLIRLPEIFH